MIPLIYKIESSVKLYDNLKDFNEIEGSSIMKKVGLIGSGRIAPFYADVLKDYDNCDVSVCGSSDSSSAKRLGR